MKKDAYTRFDYARRITEKDFEPRVREKEVVEKAESPQDSLLSIVYGIDERTGLPTGDLSYLVSDKANPQVKEFILSNLMKDVSSAQNVAAKYNLSDDDILALSRNTGESVQAYADRLNASIQRDKWMIDQYKQNVPSKPKETSVPSE